MYVLSKILRITFEIRKAYHYGEIIA